MTKNSNKEIHENESRSTLQDYILERPKLPTMNNKVVNVLDALRTLDGIKGGLVNIRGGCVGDQLFSVLETELDTKIALNIVSCCVPNTRLITPDGCTSKERKMFYNPTQTNWATRLPEVNVNYLGSRSILHIALPCASSAIYFVIAYLEVLLDVLDINLLPCDLIFQAFTKCSSWREDAFVKYAKYCTAYPFAKFLAQDVLPSKPEGLNSHVVFGGPIQKKLRARLICSADKKCAKLFFTILQGVKRGCNVVPKSYIDASYKKHVMTLSQPTKSLDRNFFYQDFGRLCGLLFNRITISTNEILQVTFPSKNASYIHTRRDGGQESDVRESLGIPYIEQVPDTPDEILDQLLEDTYYDQLGYMIDTNSGIKELRGAPLMRSQKIEILKSLFQLSSRGRELPIKCNIVALSEPLKVRIISAGEGLPYYIAKPYQKCAWAYLQHLPQFKIIGEPLSARHLVAMLDREYEMTQYLQKRNFKLFEFDAFVSGDYSAATDNLKIEYTLQAFDVIATLLLHNVHNTDNSQYSFIKAYLAEIRRLLEPHDLEYPNKKKTFSSFLKKQNELGMNIPFMVDEFMKTVTVPMATGQLMGSPVSFPFLCAINFVTYWHSINKYIGVVVPFRLLPCLINGDDILFRSNPAHYVVWQECITEVGFTLSLGKNYYHPEYLTINSILYKYRKDISPSSVLNWKAGEYPEFQKLDFFNFGLLIAQSKGRLADPRRKLPMAELYAESVGNASNKIRAHRRFIHYNAVQINLITDRGKYNLFCPINYGGLGFPIYPEVIPEIHFTKFQRRFAAFLLDETEKVLITGKFPKKYFFALMTDSSPTASLVRRTGYPEMKLGSSIPEEGFKIFIEPKSITLGAFATKHVIDEPIPEYRLPSKSLLKKFSKRQFELKELNAKNISVIDRSMEALSDEEIIHPRFTFIHQRVSPLRSHSPPSSEHVLGFEEEFVTGQNPLFIGSIGL